MNNYRHIAVEYQFDCDSPVMGTVVKYHIEPLETEVVFASGITKRFPNWDVKGCRERHYREEYVDIQLTDADVVRQGVAQQADEVVFGIRPSDVRNFVAGLAKKPFYERLFAEPSVAELAAAMTSEAAQAASASK